MRSIAIASLFVLVGTIAQAEIICTNHLVDVLRPAEEFSATVAE